MCVNGVKARQWQWHRHVVHLHSKVLGILLNSEYGATDLYIDKPLAVEWPLATAETWKRQVQSTKPFMRVHYLAQ